MAFKAIIFDLDGTLLDSLPGIAGAMNRLLEESAFPIHSLEEYRYLVGWGIRELICRALPAEVADKGDLDDWAVKFRRLYDRFWPDQSPPYPGIAGMLDHLAARGIKMAILSNKSEEYTRIMVEKLLPTWHFEAVRGERPGVPHKPDPCAALEIVQEMKVPREDFLFLGDTGVDMETARDAGIFALGALWGFRGADELLQSGAQRLIAHPLDLIPIIDHSPI